MTLRHHFPCLRLLLISFAACLVSASRFDHFSTDNAALIFVGLTPFTTVGPPNPLPECMELFGKPSKSDCAFVRTLALKTEFAEWERRGEAQRINEHDIPHPISTVGAHKVQQFLGPDSSGAGTDLSNYKLPRTWRSPLRHLSTCDITLMTHTDPGVSNKDNATFRDFSYAIQNTTNFCTLTGVGGPESGGYQIYGETNTLAVFLYAPDSNFAEAVDIEAGCVRRGRDKVFSMMQRLGFFARTCSPAEEAASDSSSSLGNDGNPDGLGNCEQKTLSRANVLYGLETPVELLATWCGVFVVELMKVDEGSV